MIQRVQSLFLLLVTILMVVVWFKPIGIFAGSFGMFQYDLLEVKDYHTLMMVKFPLWILPTLTIFTALVSLITIFLFKKRSLQKMLSIVGIVLLAAIYAVIFAYVSTINGQLSSVFHASFIMSMPGISMGLFLLAYIFIRKDEKLVKSTDRIR